MVGTLLTLPLLLLLTGIAAAQPDDGRLYPQPILTMIAMSTQQFTESDPSELVIQRFVEHVEHPLLPILFFERGATTLPSRYRCLSGSATTGKYSDTMAYILPAFGGARYDETDLHSRYYELLDVIGYRMRRQPDAVIQIEGGWSWEPTESEEVAIIRAEMVSSYLLTSWGISPDRLQIIAPQRKVDSSAPYVAQEEARRVTIHSTDTAILAPLRFDAVSGTMAVIYIRVSLNPLFSPESIQDIELTIALGDATLCRMMLPVSSDSMRYIVRGIVPIAWALSAGRKSVPPLHASAVVTLHNGHYYHAQQCSVTVLESLENDLGIARPRSYDKGRGFPIGALPYFEWRDSGFTPTQQLVLAKELNRLGSLLTDTVALARIDSMDMARTDRYIWGDMIADSQNHVYWRQRPDDPEADPDDSFSTYARNIRYHQRSIAAHRQRQNAVRNGNRLLRLIATLDESELDGELPYTHDGFRAWEEQTEAFDANLRHILLDKDNPPQLYPLSDEPEPLIQAEMMWFGSDLQQRRSKLRLLAKDARNPLIVDDNESGAQDEMLRENELKRSRLLSMGYRLSDLLRIDTNQFHIRIDTSGYDAVTSNRVIYPEIRYTLRRVHVFFDYDEELQTSNRTEQIQPFVREKD